GTLMALALNQTMVAGSNNSAVAKAESLLSPPATRTVPFVNTVAVGSPRTVNIVPASAQAPATSEIALVGTGATPAPADCVAAAEVPGLAADAAPGPAGERGAPLSASNRAAAKSPATRSTT